MLSSFLGGGGFPYPVVPVMAGLETNSVTDSVGAQAGADRLGISPSTSAFAYWLSSTPTGIVTVPAGTYRLEPGVMQFTKSNVMLQLAPGAKLRFEDALGHAGGDGFLAQDVYNCGVVGDGEVSSASPRAAGYAMHIKGGDATVEITTTQMARNQFVFDVNMSLQKHGVLVDDSTVGCWQTMIGGMKRRIWRDFTAGGTPVLYNSPGGAGHVMCNVFMSNGLGVSLGGPAVNVKGTGDLQLFMVDALGFVNGFLLNNTAPIATPVTGGGVCHIMMTACQWDNTGGAAGADNMRLVPGDITRPIVIDCAGCWCASGNNGIYANGFTGTGPVGFSMLSYNGGVIAGAVGAGVRGVSPVSAATNIKISATTNFFLNATNTDFS